MVERSPRLPARHHSEPPQGTPNHAGAALQSLMRALGWVYTDYPVPGWTWDGPPTDRTRQLHPCAVPTEETPNAR